MRLGIKEWFWKEDILRTKCSIRNTNTKPFPAYALLKPRSFQGLFFNPNFFSLPITRKNVDFGKKKELAQQFPLQAVETKCIPTKYILNMLQSLPNFSDLQRLIKSACDKTMRYGTDLEIATYGQGCKHVAKMTVAAPRNKISICNKKNNVQSIMSFLHFPHFLTFLFKKQEVTYLRFFRKMVQEQHDVLSLLSLTTPTPLFKYGQGLRCQISQCLLSNTV